MAESASARRWRRAAIVAHLALSALLVAAIPGTFRCSGDFIGSCLIFLAPLLLGAAVFILIGMARWSTGKPDLLYVADIATLILAWNSAAIGGTAFVVIAAVVSIVALVVSQPTPAERGDDPPR